VSDISLELATANDRITVLRGALHTAIDELISVGGTSEQLIDYLSMVAGARVRDLERRGAEAEELRAGLEKIIADAPGGDAESNREWKVELQRLLDRVDARDSLAHLEIVDRLREGLHEALDEWEAMEEVSHDPKIGQLRKLAGPRSERPEERPAESVDASARARSCIHCGRDHVFAHADDDAKTCPACGGELDRELLAQARIIALHWIDQDGINAAELDKLARIIDPTWTVMPPGTPARWRDFGNTVERELARMSDEELARHGVQRIAPEDRVEIEVHQRMHARMHARAAAPRSPAPTEPGAYIKPLETMIPLEQIATTPREAARARADELRNAVTRAIAKLRVPEFDSIQSRDEIADGLNAALTDTPGKPECPVCGAGACARMTGRYNDCSDPCGHDFEGGDGICSRCSALEDGQLDRFGYIRRSTVTSPYDDTIRWETDAELMRRGATVADIERMGHPERGGGMRTSMSPPKTPSADQLAAVELAREFHAEAAAAADADARAHADAKHARVAAHMEAEALGEREREPEPKP
jgi:hypothetical protein